MATRDYRFSEFNNGPPLPFACEWRDGAWHNLKSSKSLFVGIANNIWPSYGLAFLQLCASIYPGYHPGTGVGSVVIGAIYALVDGLIGGAVFGWLYNLLVGE